MPRITTGSAKNRKLKVPNIPGFQAPQDVYKLALFSIIGDKVINAECLDLYAGSGSLGLEALSRGAKWCDFVDENIKSVSAMNQNIQICGFEKQSEIFQDNAVKYVANTPKTYDLIFVDPFYTDVKHKFLLKNIEEILDTNGLVVFSHGQELDLTEQINNTSFKILTQRRFGKAYLTIINKEQA